MLPHTSTTTVQVTAWPSIKTLRLNISRYVKVIDSTGTVEANFDNQKNEFEKLLGQALH